MFRRISILLLLFLPGLCLMAQKSFVPTTHVGVHGGVDFSTMSFRPQLKQEFLPGKEFGIFFRHVSEPHIGLQLEINVADKGWKEVIDSVGTYTRKLYTIDVPVLASFIAGSKTVRFVFTIGPYLSYRRNDTEVLKLIEKQDYTALTNRTIRYNSEIIYVTETPFRRQHYYRSLASDWAFGFTGGISAEIYTKIGGFALKASYSHALTNLYPLNKGPYYFAASRMMVIYGGIGYFVSF
ncbi:MAG TPA: outer membrane beta-barrel protein [Bacteroidales bacterium]|nr:outer membrane beta-barrel protein [Bacteroidales bacterium]